MIGVEYFRNRDSLSVAKSILGMHLCTKINGVLTTGLIVETEAYGGNNDRASHAHRRRTARTEPMFCSGGTIYVYLCYGIHSLFNIVTNKKNRPEAVLVRAIEPLIGLDTMIDRNVSNINLKYIGSGPGRLTKALGISMSLSGSLLGREVWIEKGQQKNIDIETSGRIGIDYAGNDAKLQWRFYIQNNPWVSK